MTDLGCPAACAHLPGADQVLIFGSWAARCHQQPGPPPHDLDVLVVGEPARDAEQRLGLPVNPVIRTTAACVAAFPADACLQAPAIEARPAYPGP